MRRCANCQADAEEILTIIMPETKHVFTHYYCIDCAPLVVVNVSIRKGVKEGDLSSDRLRIFDGKKWVSAQQ